MAFEKEKQEAFKSSDLIGPKTKIKGDFWINVICPICGKHKGSVHVKDPHMLFCWSGSCPANKNNGGLNLVKHFGLSFNYEKTYPSTKENPTRPVDEWLINERKIPREVFKGIRRRCIPNVRGSKSCALVFYVGMGVDGKETWNGRILNPPPGEGKSHGWGKQKGLYGDFGKELDVNEEVIIVEGAVSCLSLIAFSLQSIYVFSANAQPDELDLRCFKNLTILFDNDIAGRSCMKRFLKVYPDANPLLLSPGIDANDLLRKYGVEEGAKYFKKNRPQFEFNAQLTLSNTAKEHANLYYQFHGKALGLFTHLGATYHAALKTKKDTTTVSIERVGKFTLKVIAYFWDTTNPNNHICLYQLEIIPQGGFPVKATADSKNLSTPRGIREFLLSSAKVNFEGGTQAATALATRISTSKAPEVTTLPLVGWDDATNWYVFRSVAIDPNGTLHKPDKRGFFKVNHRHWVQPPAHASDKAIIPGDTGKPIRDIHKLIFEGWGHRGATCLAWVVASWYTSVIKNKINFMPFLDVFGGVQSGKTSLAVVLSQLQGFDNEGITASSLNTRKGLVRNIGRVSNLFSAILEGNTRDDKTGFDHSSILPLYNRNPLRTTAKFSADLQTVETPFAGALAFVANNSVFEGKAERERTVSIEFKTDHLSTSSRAAHDQLCKIPLPELARTIVLTLKHRKVFEKEWYGSFLAACNDLDAIKNRRIRENHALILAYHRIFCKIHGIKNCRLKPYLEKIGKLKEITSTDREHSLVEDLFEKIDMIDDSKLVNCLHTDKETGRIYISLPDIEKNLRSIGYQFVANKQLFDSLQQHPAFVKSRFPFRFPNATETGTDGRPKLRRVWVFSARDL